MKTIRVLIVWGSETNNTQGFVNKITDEWKDKYGDVLKVLDVFQGDDCADKWDTVTKENYDFLLIATSSYGEGEPPSGFGRFLYCLQEASKAGDESQLKGLQHAVLGIGSTCYDTFQNCPRHVDKYLGEAGSRRIKQRFEWDEMEHVDSDVLEWGDEIYKVMTTQLDDDENSKAGEKEDVCSWKEPKDELLSKIVGEDGYEIGEGPGEGFGLQQKIVMAAVVLGGAAVYYYKKQQALAAAGGGEAEL